MTQGRYCHYCGGFYHHSHICCYENRDGGSNIQNVVLVNNTTTYTETEYNSYSSSSSSSVDCTLSLGTPSTRLSEKDEKNKGSASSSISNFSDTSKTSPYNAFPCSRRGVSSGSDTLLDHRCTNCDTTSTPLWRNGPRGPKSLCNACGIRFKRREEDDNGGDSWQQRSRRSVRKSVKS